MASASFHREYYSLHNLLHASGCALDFFSCIGRGTGQAGYGDVLEALAVVSVS